ncbi:hypothetical protein ABOM_007975 [Aspergillus bombycis]|uniref:Cytochrome P450 n=1 Tax=Aspergillus bombycis TaxID=109264 RepID=A0A1F7ZY47_9EURO|nr:hypothetical protein ABOM_007975 [Aspergillus bombycis]OGM43968.1 hypothetical protein ABOM_007975 [Aspergillus bombycis]
MERELELRCEKIVQHTMSNYPGFEVFSEGAHDSELLKRVIRSHLSKGLESLTVPISDETTFAISQTFTDRKDWHAIPLKHMVMEIVVRISSRIFTGPELCRDPEWLQISIQYTISAMRAVHELRRYHPLARPIMHWYLSSCGVLRRMIEKTRMIMNRVIENRQLEQYRKGRIDHNDALEWFEQNAKGQAYDPAITQLVLMFVSAHTTTDLLTQVILDLARNQEWIEPLRAEVQAELAKNGRGGFSPHNLKLLDSVIKETQRLKPIGITSMRRIATETVQLSDGTSIAKGTSLMVLADRHWDHFLYNDANRFQGDRFLRKRAERGNDAAASLVGISPDHLGFGYGLHACPGRFFAALEVKIVMCHILLKYNWKLPVGEDPQPQKLGVFLDSDPVAVVNIQRRDEEVKL